MGRFLLAFPQRWVDRAALAVVRAGRAGGQDARTAAAVERAVQVRARSAFVRSLSRWSAVVRPAALVRFDCRVGAWDEPPVVAGTRLLAASMDGQLYAFEGQSDGAPGQLPDPSAREVRRLEKQVHGLEQQLERKEARVQELEALMSQPGFFDAPERSTPVVTEHKALTAEVAQAYDALEAAMLELEAARG